MYVIRFYDYNNMTRVSGVVKKKPYYFELKNLTNVYTIFCGTHPLNRKLFAKQFQK